MKDMRRMAYFMIRCPFWSTAKEKVECYRECPILTSESPERQEDENCIFNDCTESGGVNFRDVMKEDYGFMSSYVYDEDKAININY